ncbi:hypothetical protein GmHk_08G023567 [Glycine max]|nr:hypothetical protein GmHk_08G023567 [Glycine max]
MFFYPFVHSFESILGVRGNFTAFTLRVYTHFLQKPAMIGEFPKEELEVISFQKHVAPLPPKKSSKSAISSSSWASSPSPGASGGASPAWASGQSPGHATSALNWSGVGHEKEAKPWLCMLRLSWYRQSWVCTCARWLAACWRTKCRKYCSMSNDPAGPA